jgi:hypothetical protein
MDVFDKNEDENNFKMEVRGHQIVMDDGDLSIDDVAYEDDPTDTTTYDIVRELWCWTTNRRENHP